MSKEVLLQNDKARIIDTRTMEWADPLPQEPLHGVPGAKVKVLARFDTGEPRVQMMYVPPGIDNLNPAGVAERHYHKTVREWVYILSGEMPFREYEYPDQKEGNLVWYRTGMLLDRLPGSGSAHGLDPGNGGTVGCVCLEWKTGFGTALSEKGSDKETVVVTEEQVKEANAPARPSTVTSGPGIVYKTPSVTIYDTLAMPWHVPGPGEAFHGTGAKVKVLSRADEGYPNVQSLWFPPGSTSMGHGGKPERHYHSTVQEWVFTLDGELAVREYGYDETGPGERVDFRAGVFLERKPGPGGFHGVDKAAPSPVGFHCLEWRIGSGSAAGEVGTEQENVVIH
jgi:uncharacterized cupin superfamily protein